jgi:hypothetical protein
MGDGSSKTGPVMVQALTEVAFDPAGHDHSKTICMQLEKEKFDKRALQEKLDKLTDEQVDRVIEFLGPQASEDEDGESDLVVNLDLLSPDQQIALSRLVDAELQKAALRGTPTKKAADSDGFEAPDSEGSTPSFAGDSLKSLDFCDSPESTPKAEGMPDDTIIIFDWDDTLLCSTAINTRRWDSVKLEELQETVERVLRTAARLGQVLIVTNGVDWWVDDSARRFLPGLLPLLETLTVRSARASWECKFPGDPFAWKREEFREILLPRQRSTNLVVLGDSLAEIHAAQGLYPLMSEGSLVKTVKFKEAPSADQVIGQLRSVAAELADIVQQRASISRELVQGGMQEQLLQMVGCTTAGGWRLHETEVLEPKMTGNN